MNFFKVPISPLLASLLMAFKNSTLGSNHFSYDELGPNGFLQGVTTDNGLVNYADQIEITQGTFPSYGWYDQHDASDIYYDAYAYGIYPDGDAIPQVDSYYVPPYEMSAMNFPYYQAAVENIYMSPDHSDMMTPCINHGQPDVMTSYINHGQPDVMTSCINHGQPDVMTSYINHNQPGKRTSYTNRNRSSALIPSHDNLYQPPLDDGFDYCSEGASVPLNCSISLGAQNRAYQYDPNQVYRPFEGVHESHEYPPLISSISKKAIVPTVLPDLPEISTPSPELRRRLQGLSYDIPKQLRLVHRTASKRSPNFQKLIIYSTFRNRSSRNSIFWGRTEKRELYVRVGRSTVFLFEMKPGPGLDLPKFEERSWFDFDDFKRNYANTQWCVKFGGSDNSLVKVGGDPSKVMTLWTIINGKVDEIDLEDQEIPRRLLLQEGGLLVAIPAQLRGIMNAAKGVKSYEEFLSFIQPNIQLRLDQLVFIIQVNSVQAQN